MRKTLLALCASILAFGSMYAVPAKPGKPLTFTQSDGTKIQVSMVGDEFRHSFVTTDGITVAQAENGDFYYRTPAGISDRLAHNATDRSASEASWIASQAEALSISATPNKARKRAAAQKSPQVPCTGSPKIPILLVQYTDKKMSNTKEDFETIYSKSAKSAKQ